MNSLASSTPPTGQPRLQQLPESTRVSSYERVVSMLLALVMMVGALVGGLLLVWLTSRVYPIQKSVPVTMTEGGGGGMPNGVANDSMEIKTPTNDEIAAETDLEQPVFSESLSVITDAVALHHADLDSPQFIDTFGGGRGKPLQGTGNSPGLGNGSGAPGVARERRWEIHFPEGSTLQEYGHQLDAFGIELGVIGTSQKIEYGSHWSNNPPQSRTGQRHEESRLYMSWRSGKLRDADESLLKKAGISAAGKIIVQFYPLPVEQQLSQLEHKFANRDEQQIRKTRFGVRRRGAAYEFYVIDQTPMTSTASR